MPEVIVGVDGSDHSRRALEWAVGEAAVHHAPLTVLTATQPVTGHWGGPMVYLGGRAPTEQARKETQEQTDRALEKAGPGSRPPSVAVLVVVGPPAEALLKAAAEADMLVVGARGSGGFKRLLMGSVSTQVSHHARCPVVIVPDENV